MAKETSKTVNKLPAYTNIENIIILINSIKVKGKNEDETKALFNKADSAYSNSKSALKALGIIENDGLDFTDAGRNIAFSSDTDRKTQLLKLIRNYAPYELIFNKVALSTAKQVITDVDEIKNTWGKANYGSSDRNRQDAATLFMGMVDFLGLGKFVKGAKGTSTRIEWINSIKENLTISSNDSSASEDENPFMISKGEEKSRSDESLCVDENKQEINSLSNDREPVNMITDPTYKQSISRNININVDMSNWDDYKIKLFFKYAHGIFEED